MRQWLFQTGYIQYIIDGQIWTADNTSALQIAHFRASRPCYVNLLRKFTVSDWEEDKDDEFMDYIENCDGKIILYILKYLFYAAKKAKSALVVKLFHTFINCSSSLLIVFLMIIIQSQCAVV